MKTPVLPEWVLLASILTAGVLGMAGILGLAP